MNLVDGLEGVLAFHEEIKVQTCNKLELRAKCLGSFQFLYTKKIGRKMRWRKAETFPPSSATKKVVGKKKKTFVQRKTFLCRLEFNLFLGELMRFKIKPGEGELK
jgi:hypothetical protein